MDYEFVGEDNFIHHSKKSTINYNQAKKAFTLVETAGLLDIRLSWKAKGILVFLLSKVYTHETPTYEDLLKQSADDETTLQEGINELIQYGYLKEDFWHLTSQFL